LDSAYQSGAILDRSVAVRPSAFDPVSKGKHRCSFLPDISAGVITSDPVVAAATPLAELITTTARERVPQVRTRPVSLRRFASGLSEQFADELPEPGAALARAAQQGETGPILR